jgi:hypothetical protein
LNRDAKYGRIAVQEQFRQIIGAIRTAIYSLGRTAVWLRSCLAAGWRRLWRNEVAHPMLRGKRAMRLIFLTISLMTLPQIPC